MACLLAVLPWPQAALLYLAGTCCYISAASVPGQHRRAAILESTCQNLVPDRSWAKRSTNTSVLAEKKQNWTVRSPAALTVQRTGKKSCVPCVPCVSRLPPVSFYRYCTGPVCVSRLSPVSFYRYNSTGYRYQTTQQFLISTSVTGYRTGTAHTIVVHASRSQLGPSTAVC